MIKHHTENNIPEIQKIVSPEFCKKLAFQTGFIKRTTSRLNGYEFVNAMILGNGDDSLFTYSQRIITFNQNSKLSLPALAQRINRESAEKLMFAVFIKCLTNTYERGITKFKNIKRILLQDSTCLPLNKRLAAFYPGSGGHKKTSGLKIDCIYDYTNEIVLNVHQCARTRTDAQNSNEIFKYLKPGDLVLRDLGYFKFEDLNNIEHHLGYYVSRMKVNVKVYLKSTDNQPVNFIKFLKKKMKKETFLDCNVFIGHDKKKTRIVVCKLPDKMINERLRKAHRGAQVARTTLSDSKKAFLSYIILITNLPTEIATSTEIINIYRIRWRIELLFKEWKSQLCIENIIGTNIHRIRCLIYGRLCLILMMNKLTSYLSALCLQLYGRELSVKKALDLLLKDGGLIELFLSKKIKNKLESIKNNSLHMLLKNKRIKRKSTRETILELLLVA